MTKFTIAGFNHFQQIYRIEIKTNIKHVCSLNSLCIGPNKIIFCMYNLNKAKLVHWLVSDRMHMQNIGSTLHGKSFNIAIVQAHAPIPASIRKMDVMIYSNQVKSNEVLLVVGYLKAKAGRERSGNIVSPRGLERRMCEERNE